MHVLNSQCGDATTIETTIANFDIDMGQYRGQDEDIYPLVHSRVDSDPVLYAIRDIEEWPEDEDDDDDDEE